MLRKDKPSETALLNLGVAIQFLLQKLKIFYFECWGFILLSLKNIPEKIECALRKV